MPNSPTPLRLLPLLLLCSYFVNAHATSFGVQCPEQTATHPLVNASGQVGQPDSTLPNPDIKCQQISGGDGFATMADGTQTYLFAFGPLSGLADIVKGLPGTEPASIFNQVATTNPGIGDPTPATTYNGAVGLIPDPQSNPPNQINGHVDPRPIMDVGILNGSMPGPTMAIDEDDEFFLTLTNVGMIMRPDLFEQHTIHFHGYPNASAYFDGVPDASVAINIGGSFTYYYLAPDAGTYMWHCHITPPEHLQMGMVGQVYVRPRQNRVPVGESLYDGLVAQQSNLRIASNCDADILCSSPLPPANSVVHEDNKSGTPTLYAYNDGDGSTAYDVEYALQIHGFDPNFHFVGMTFNPEPFTDNTDKYFLLNGRSYPDTVNPEPLHTQAADGVERYSQPMSALINIPAGGKALLRLSDLDVTEMQTLASLGIPMHVIGYNAKLLRDMAGNDMSYFTNSITLGGGESLDVILDASDTARYPVGSTYYLYTPNLHHLSNDAENFGGLMTEVHICSAVDPKTKACSI